MLHKICPLSTLRSFNLDQNSEVVLRGIDLQIKSKVDATGSRSAQE